MKWRQGDKREEDTLIGKKYCMMDEGTSRGGKNGHKLDNWLVV